jgi:hypothetical protein
MTFLSIRSHPHLNHMPPSKSSTPSNRESCLPGLLAIADLAERIPERAKELYAVEIERRKHDLLRIGEELKKLSWHPWSTIQLLIVTGFASFAISWGAGMMLDFLQLIDKTVNKANGAPTSVSGIGIPSISTILPPQFAGAFTTLPHIGVLESFYIALSTVLTIAFIKLIIILANWEKIKIVSATEKRTNAEVEALKEWALGERKAAEKKA